MCVCVCVCVCVCARFFRTVNVCVKLGIIHSQIHQFETGSFIRLQRKESMLEVVRAVDKANGYVHGPGEQELLYQS